MNKLLRFGKSTSLYLLKGIRDFTLMVIIAAIVGSLIMGIAWLIGNSLVYYSHLSYHESGHGPSNNLEYGVLSLFGLFILFVSGYSIIGFIKRFKKEWERA